MPGTLLHRTADVIALVASVSLAAASVCGCNSPEEQPPAAAPPQGNAFTIAIPPAAASMGSRAYGANPQVLAAGVTVTWLNMDTVAHTVQADDGTFNSGPILPKSVFVFTFPQSGTHSYHCLIHGEAAESGALQLQ